MQYIRQTYRLYPNKEQAETINQWIGNCRWLWNHMLSKNIEHHDKTGKFVFAYEMSNMLPELKSEIEWLGLAPSQGLQQKCQDLDTAMKRCFKKTSRFPKFKSKFSDTSGIRLPAGWKFNGKNRINFPKLKGVRVKKHVEVEGKAGALTIKRDRVGDYWVSILYQVADHMPPVKNVEKIVGIDLGLKEFAVTSDCEIIKNPRHLAKSEKKLKKEQRSHSRKKKGSNNREKQRIKLAKVYRKITRQRTEFIRTTANSIAKQNDAVFVEDLNAKGMMRNHKLAKAIADVSWGRFLSELEWQCKKHQSHSHRVDRFFASSKTCSSCGWKNDHLTLANRTFSCSRCDTEIDRDLNAALNIINKGIQDKFPSTAATVGIDACEDMKIEYDFSPGSHESLKTHGG